MKPKRIVSLAAALVLALAAFPTSALAAGNEASNIQLPPSVVYPAEVRAYEENGLFYLEKVYYLTARDDPAAIPTGDLEREGRIYTLLDILKNDQRETDTKDYIETRNINSDTNDMAAIIKALEPELEIVTEEGYTGVLKPVYPSITVEAAGYKTSSWTVTATRTYPNLSGADLSLIPKTIEDNGRTLTLADVDWQSAATDYESGYEVPIRYTAVASYTGTASGKYATGYTVTVDYAGEVTRTSLDVVIYTAVFASHGETQIEAPNETEDPANAGTSVDTEQTAKLDARVLLIPVAVLLLGLAAWGARRGLKYYKDKKRGYVK